MQAPFDNTLDNPGITNKNRYIGYDYSGSTRSDAGGLSNIGSHEILTPVGNYWNQVWRVTLNNADKTAAVNKTTQYAAHVYRSVSVVTKEVNVRPSEFSVCKISTLSGIFFIITQLSGKIISKLT
jgi:hypothetical protein